MPLIADAAADIILRQVKRRGCRNRGARSFDMISEATWIPMRAVPELGVRGVPAPSNQTHDRVQQYLKNTWSIPVISFHDFQQRIAKHMVNPSQVEMAEIHVRNVISERRGYMCVETKSNGAAMDVARS